MQGDPDLNARGKHPVVESMRLPDPSGTSLSVLPIDDPDWGLRHVDSPPQVNDVRIWFLSAFGPAKSIEEGPSLQAFGVEGERLFDDPKERCHFSSSCRELASLSGYTDSLAAAL